MLGLLDELCKGRKRQKAFKAGQLSSSKEFQRLNVENRKEPRPGNYRGRDGFGNEKRKWDCGSVEKADPISLRSNHGLKSRATLHDSC